MNSGGETALGWSLQRRWIQLRQFVFGDRWGVILFLTCIVVLGLFWRVGTFITDTATMVRTLEAIAGGQLHLDTVSGTHFQAPGTVVSDGQVYGRGYGQVFAALPILWVLEALGRIANLRVGLVAIWHLALLWLVVRVGEQFGVRRAASNLGSVVVLASFLGNVWMASSLQPGREALLALQISSLLAAGLLAVLSYRLVGIHHNQGVALAAGYAAVLAIPVGFWAQIPKRHVIVGAMLIGILFLFARSRSEAATDWVAGLERSTLERAGAYALVGLLAWINAAEAVFVLLALVVVDLPTAPSNAPRTLGVIGVAFAISLLPFMLTNWLVSGDPMRPVLTLRPADRVAGPTGNMLRDTTAASGGSLFDTLPGSVIVSKIIWLVTLVLTQITESVHQLTDSTAVFRTWIRSGSLEGVVTRGQTEFRATNITVLESMPLLGAVTVLLGTAWQRGSGVFDQVSSTDLLAATLTASFVLLYMQSLPNHAQMTVRYLVPIYPVAVYGLARQRPIRRLLEDGAGFTVWTYSAAVLVGSQLLLAYTVLAGLSIPEAVQLHAVIALGAAIGLGVTAIASQFAGRYRPLAGLALGVAAGAGTSFILLSGFAYFSFVGEYVLPISQAVADLIGQF